MVSVNVSDREQPKQLEQRSEPELASSRTDFGDKEVSFRFGDGRKTALNISLGLHHDLAAARDVLSGDALYPSDIQPSFSTSGSGQAGPSNPLRPSTVSSALNKSLLS